MHPFLKFLLITCMCYLVHASSDCKIYETITCYQPFNTTITHVDGQVYSVCSGNCTNHVYDSIACCYNEMCTLQYNTLTEYQEPYRVECATRNGTKLESVQNTAHCLCDEWSSLYVQTGSNADCFCKKVGTPIQTYSMVNFPTIVCQLTAIPIWNCSEKACINPLSYDSKTVKSLLTGSESLHSFESISVIVSFFSGSLNVYPKNTSLTSFRVVSGSGDPILIDRLQSSIIIPICDSELQNVAVEVSFIEDSKFVGPIMLINRPKDACSGKKPDFYNDFANSLKCVDGATKFFVYAVISLIILVFTVLSLVILLLFYHLSRKLINWMPNKVPSWLFCCCRSLQSLKSKTSYQEMKELKTRKFTNIQLWLSSEYRPSEDPSTIIDDLVLIEDPLNDFEFQESPMDGNDLIVKQKNVTQDLLLREELKKTVKIPLTWLVIFCLFFPLALCCEEFSTVQSVNEVCVTKEHNTTCVLNLEAQVTMGGDGSTYCARVKTSSGNLAASFKIQQIDSGIRYKYTDYYKTCAFQYGFQPQSQGRGGDCQVACNDYDGYGSGYTSGSCPNESDKSLCPACQWRRFGGAGKFSGYGKCRSVNAGWSLWCGDLIDVTYARFWMEPTKCTWVRSLVATEPFVVYNVSVSNQEGDFNSLMTSVGGTELEIGGLKIKPGVQGYTGGADLSGKLYAYAYSRNSDGESATWCLIESGSKQGVPKSASFGDYQTNDELDKPECHYAVYDPMLPSALVPSGAYGWSFTGPQTGFYSDNKHMLPMIQGVDQTTGYWISPLDPWTLEARSSLIKLNQLTMSTKLYTTLIKDISIPTVLKFSASCEGKRGLFQGVEIFYFCASTGGDVLTMYSLSGTKKTPIGLARCNRDGQSVYAGSLADTFVNMLMVGDIMLEVKCDTPLVVTLPNNTWYYKDYYVKPPKQTGFPDYSWDWLSVGLPNLFEGLGAGLKWLINVIIIVIVVIIVIIVVVFLVKWMCRAKPKSSNTGSVDSHQDVDVHITVDQIPTSDPKRPLLATPDDQ